MLDGNCTNIKVILILSVWGILEEKISRTDRDGGRNQANQLKYWNKKVIQRLSSREGVGMHLPCLCPVSDILILDVGIVSCFSRKCLNSGLEPSILYFFETASVYQCLMKHLNFVKSWLFLLADDFTIARRHSYTHVHRWHK